MNDKKQFRIPEQDIETKAKIHSFADRIRKAFGYDIEETEDSKMWVTCRLCNKKFFSLCYHLPAVHKVGVFDYLRLFPSERIESVNTVKMRRKNGTIVQTKK